MNEIGSKIKEARKMKGLSQEEVAEKAKINLRTIQRIESNQNEPRGKTLSLIFAVLELRTEDILDYGKRSDNSYLVFFHLSVLAFIPIPLGNIILPLILWLTNRHKIIGLDKIGANLLNYQITWTILSSLSFGAGFFFKIIHYDTFTFPLFILFILLYALNIILPIVFAIRARKTLRQKPYPVLIRFIR